MFGPVLGAKPFTPRIMKFTILVKALLLYITMHLVFLAYMYFQRRFFLKKMAKFDTFCPAPKAPGGQET
jgi:hypothetical protein